MTDETEPEVIPINYGGKMYDLNKLSDDQKQSIITSQRVGQAIDFLQGIAALKDNIGNIANLAAIGRKQVEENTAKTFPGPIEAPIENGATSPETPAPATLTADDAKETAEQSDSGEVVPPTEPEGKTH